MIDVYYAITNMDSEYVLAGLKVAADIGGVVVTVQQPGRFSGERAVVSYKGRNLQIVDTEYLDVKEHAARLRAAIMEAGRLA
jgi:hypothetical protein